jgi:anti-anti-sigma factor
MNISISQVQGKVPVTVLKLEGQLDGQTYQDLINKAREAYKAGWRDFLVDMADLTYISSAGLVALHSVAYWRRVRNSPILMKAGPPIVRWDVPRKPGYRNT